MPTKSLQSMAAPLVVSFTLRFLFTFVDLAYAAVLQDDNAAVAAIGFYAPVQSVYIAVWVGLSAGFTACLSKAFGQKDDLRVAQLQRSMMAILVWLIPGLMAVGGVLYLLVPHLGLEPRLADAFRIYATTMTVGMPLTGFWSIYPDSIVKAHQDTRSTMVAGLASSVTNVALNTLFVFAFGWGIFGIAFATVVSRLAGLGYALRRARALERGRFGTDWSRHPRSWPAPTPTILRLAVPGGLTFLLTALEGGVINKVLTGLPDSTTAIASFAVYQQVLMLALMPAYGTAVAVVPYVALGLPTGDVARIRRELRRAQVLIAALALAITAAAGWLFAAPLAEFFVSRRPDGAAATSVAPQTLGALRLLPLGALVAVPFTVLRPVFEAAHRPQVGIQVSIARFVLLSLPLLLAGRHLAPALGFAGLHGMILGIAAATALAGWWTARLARDVLRDAAAPGPPAS